MQVWCGRGLSPRTGGEPVVLSVTIPSGVGVQSRGMEPEGLGSNPACILSSCGPRAGRPPCRSLGFVSVTRAGVRMRGADVQGAGLSKALLVFTLWGPQALHRDPTGN